MDARVPTRVELEGELVLLRPVASSDASAAFELLHGREPILRWLLWDGPLELGELERHYSSWIRPGKSGSDLSLAIVERGSERFAGSIVLRFEGHPEVGDVGYWLGEFAWGRGYATEAIALAVHLAFEHLFAPSLCAWVFVGNHASRRALEKNGFQHVRTTHGAVTKRGRPVEEWYLALLRDEWSARPHLCPRREDVRFD